MPPTALWRRIFEGPVDSPSFEGSPCSCCHSMPAVVVFAVDSAVVFAVDFAVDFRCQCCLMTLMKSCWHSGLASKALEGHSLCTHKGHR